MAAHEIPEIPNAADTVGGRIRQARRLADLSQKELGQAIGASRESVWNWEAGRFPPTADHLIRIARATGVRPGWFLDGLPPDAADVTVEYGRPPIAA